MKDLEKFREKIREIDEQILELISQRLNTAKQIGNYKLKHKLSIKNYEVEKKVFDRNLKKAKELGVYKNLAQTLTKLLIQYSVNTQDKIPYKIEGEKKSVLIIGGYGKMGNWFANFFGSFGHNIIINDMTPKKANNKYDFIKDLKTASQHADIIVICSPILETPAIINQLAAFKVKGLVFDISSLKTPLLKAIKQAENKIKITSIHPMFGPSVEVLAGEKLILCETSNKRLCDETDKLFNKTSLNILRLPIEKHDEIISYVLGLSHLTNLLFAKTLKNSGFSFDVLSKHSSSTFKAQLEVSLPVVNENKDLYYEIQAENYFTKNLIDALIKDISDYKDVILNKNKKEFQNYMEQSKTFFGDLRGFFG